MSYKLSKTSLRHLQGVHPDLRRLVPRALELSPYDFGITEGVRTAEEQAREVAEGDSDTLNSLHLVQRDGFSHAIDFAVYVNGRITWDVKYYRKVIQAFFTAAIEMGIQIEAGGLWRDLVDGPHIQLNRRYYNGGPA